MKRTILISTLSLATGLAIGGFVACSVDEGVDDTIESRDAEELADEEVDELADAESMLRPLAMIAAVSQVQVHHIEHGWTSIPTKALIDLMRPKLLQEMLADARLADGAYDQISLDIRFLGVQTHGGWVEVELPGLKDVLKVHANFCVRSGDNNMPLDWNAPAFLNWNEKQGYWLERAITVRSEADCRGLVRDDRDRTDDRDRRDVRDGRDARVRDDGRDDRDRAFQKRKTTPDDDRDGRLERPERG